MLLDALRMGKLDARTVLWHMRAVGQEERWLIPSKRVVLGDVELGRGGFGYVTLGEYLGSPAAIKRPHQGTEKSEELHSQLNELRILRYIRHPHIASFYGAVMSERLPGRVALVLEFVDGPSMFDYVRGSAHSDWHALCLLAGVCLGLRYLHESKPAVVHGDVKPGNIMVASAHGEPHAKIVDLGLSRKIEHGSDVLLGRSVKWSAPEVLRGDTVTRASDIFAFAYVIYFAFSKRVPWEGWKMNEVTNAAIEKPADLEPELTRLQLLKPMLEMDPGERCRIRQVHRNLAELSVQQCGKDPFGRRLSKLSI